MMKSDSQTARALFLAGVLCAIAWGCSNRTPHDVAAEGDMDAVESKVEASADINATDANGWTPLHYAAWNGDEKATDDLLRASAEVNAPDDSGRTPLHLAARRDHTIIVYRLLASGADINIKDARGRTPLEVASKRAREVLERYRRTWIENGPTGDGPA